MSGVCGAAPRGPGGGARAPEEAQADRDPPELHHPLPLPARGLPRHGAGGLAQARRSRAQLTPGAAQVGALWVVFTVGGLSSLWVVFIVGGLHRGWSSSWVVFIVGGLHCGWSS